MPKAQSAPVAAATAMVFEDMGIAIANDPLRVDRPVVPGGRFGKIFAAMKPGQCIVAEPEKKQDIAKDMRRWINKQGLPYVVRTIKSHPADGKCRVWMMEADK